MDDIPGIYWIIVAVVERNYREFVKEMIPNRQKALLENFLDKE